MHKWESVPRLISEFENQDVGDPYVYKDFTYQLDEFDNVPPVIPRFQFYLQVNVKPLFSYLKELKESQQVHELRNESINLVKETNLTVERKEQALKDQIKLMNDRCDDLQR